MVSWSNTSLLVPMLVTIAASQPADWSTAFHRGDQAMEGGRLEEAVTCYREAVDVAVRFGPRDPRGWMSYNALGVAYAESGMTAESMRSIRKAMVLLKDSEGKDSENYARILMNLADAYLDDNQRAAGEHLLREALSIEERLPEPDAITVAAIRIGLSSILMGRDNAEAEQLLQIALPVFEEKSQTIELSIALNDLCLLRRLQHRYGESLDAIHRAIASLELRFGADHPLLLKPLNSLAVVSSLAGDNQAAAAAFLRADRICEMRLPPAHPTRALLLDNYAAFLRRTGHRKEAKQVQAKARSLWLHYQLREAANATVDVAAFQK